MNQSFYSPQISIRASYEEIDFCFLPDARVFIDVFRASTTCTALVEAGVSQLIVNNDLATLSILKEQGYTIFSEVFNLGFDNSPTLAKKMSAELKNKPVVLKTANLTTAIEKNTFDGDMYLCCFNNLSSTVDFIRRKKICLY